MKRKKRSKSRHVRADFREFRNPATWIAWSCLMLGVFAALVTMIVVGSSLPWLRERNWIVAPMTLAIVSGAVGPMLLPALHWKWYVNAVMVRSVQPGRSGAYQCDFPNGDFVSLRTIGPLAHLRQRSGRNLYWPRWLRREGRTYVFVLQGEQVALVPTGREGQRPAGSSITPSAERGALGATTENPPLRLQPLGRESAERRSSRPQTTAPSSKPSPGSRGFPEARPGRRQAARTLKLASPGRFITVLPFGGAFVGIGGRPRASRRVDTLAALR
jgi:hypothetical protein